MKMNLKKSLLISTAIALSCASPLKSCEKHYKLTENDDIFQVILSNKISFHKFKYLNGNKNLHEFKAGDDVCVAGKANYKNIIKLNANEFFKMGKPSKKQIEIGNQFIKSTLNSTQIKKLNKNVKYIKEIVDDSLDAKDQSPFSLEKCKRKCDRINKTISSLNRNPNEMFSIKLLNNIYRKTNRPLIKENTLYMSCMSNCYMENDISKEKQPMNEITHDEEVNEIDDNEIDDSKLNKRATCPSIDKLREYRHEKLVVPVYQNSRNDVRTRVDGCSSKVLIELADYFTPACNGHDACYHCLSKTQCDNDFYDNMQEICEKYYPGFSNIIDYTQSGHTGDRNWKSDCKCTDEIKSKLVSKLFELA
ncbi:hypothetical protein PIROE2DRAFT_11026 [Piromyces sp. E2]|nr:hypothetical protein PIROE2DRAFT_11026 [Piromyces sp. E2]|eukprot:OUM62650.1 hypothetical protein PIROE2DRAFT_11026 [Piromyces sp. E2]